MHTQMGAVPTKLTQQQERQVGTSTDTAGRGCGLHAPVMGTQQHRTGVCLSAVPFLTRNEHQSSHLRWSGGKYRYPPSAQERQQQHWMNSSMNQLNTQVLNELKHTVWEKAFRVILTVTLWETSVKIHLPSRFFCLYLLSDAVSRSYHCVSLANGLPLLEIWNTR